MLPELSTTMLEDAYFDMYDEMVASDAATDTVPDGVTRITRFRDQSTTYTLSDPSTDTAYIYEAVNGIAGVDAANGTGVGLEDGIFHTVVDSSG